MESYTYNKEIRRMVLHFMSAIDGAVVKRYNNKDEPIDEIKVNYLYGPKQRIYKDIIDPAEHIKLPVVSVMLTGVKRDSERVRDNIVGRYESLITNKKETNLEIPSPIPVNLTFELSIIAKYQMDLEQILTNFIPYSDPYFIVSWREPFTNQEIRSEILWQEDVTISTPKELQPKDPYSRIEASTSFVFKGYMFKNKANDVGRICRIDSDFILNDKWFCSYDSLQDYSETLDKESFTIIGTPKTEWADPVVIKTGSLMEACSGFNSNDIYNPNERVGRTETLTINGQFIDVTDVFLSASDPSMFETESVSSIDIFNGSSQFPKFNGVLVKKFEYKTGQVTKISFDLPVIIEAGYIDVIVVNSCGYSKLSQDRRKLENTMDNPYNSSHPLYSSWNRLHDPFINGIEVIKTNLICSSGEDITVLGTIGGKVIKTLADMYIIEI